MGNENKEYYIWLSEHNHSFDISEAEAAQILKDAEGRGYKVITIESEEYPMSLRMIKDPPLVLYCLGDASLLNTPGVPRLSVVGTRRASPYGRWAASEIGKTIARCGAIHISGMAEGIDAAGHRAVLDNGGKSIAVLGTGVDVCFPKSSGDIYEELKEKGLIISEYKPGTTGYKSNFPERNRIISGLSEKCVIVEGQKRSGSLITANIAAEQNKELYAVPGNINQPNSIGPNILIEDGAIPIVNPTEIAETLGIGFLREKITAQRLKGLDAKIYEIVKRSGSIKTEEIMSYINDAPEKIMASLTMLELQGLIRNDGGLIS